MTTVLVVIGGLLTLVTFVGVTWKILRFIFRIDRALPTMLNIAAQFENNGGSTLKDKIDNLHANQAVIKENLDEHYMALEAADRFTLKIAEDSRTIANTNAAIVHDLSLAQSEDIKHIKDYIHEVNHGLRTEMGKQQLIALNAEDRMTRIEDTLNVMLPLIARHRKDDP